MKIDSQLVRRLRKERQWSQSQLADTCGVTLRTIQRLESTGRASIESVRALASVFEVAPSELIVDVAQDQPLTAFGAVRLVFIKFADFSGTASRAEYWWFLLFFALVTAAATLVADVLAQLIALVLLVPFVAVGSRRLNDAGYSPWWQLLFLVPFGFVPVLFLMAQERGQAADVTNAA